MDLLIVNQLVIKCVIGTLPWERQIKQTIVLDLELGLDITEAAQSDALTKTVDYAVLCERVKAYVSDSQFQLLEALAEHTAAMILQEFKVTEIFLKVIKLGVVSDAKSIACAIRRRRAI